MLPRFAKIFKYPKIYKRVGSAHISSNAAPYCSFWKLTGKINADDRSRKMTYCSSTNKLQSGHHSSGNQANHFSWHHYLIFLIICLIIFYLMRQSSNEKNKKTIIMNYLHEAFRLIQEGKINR